MMQGQAHEGESSSSVIPYTCHSLDSASYPPSSQIKTHTRTPPPTLFERYTIAQEWLEPSYHTRFFATLRRSLPVCFRLRTPSAVKEWNDILRTSYNISARRLPCGAWQMSSRFLIEDEYLRSWISSRTKSGHVSRQEFVSMIPVLLLNINRHHRVLDLCASLGSKTIQALDALYQDHEENEDDGNQPTSKYPKGFILANEIDASRSYVLAHRCRETLQHRMVSLAVVTHNAIKFPNILANLTSASTSASDTPPDRDRKPFDRIICDVPCSGDGTLRKDFKVWNTWHPGYGIALHPIQLRIAKRGIALLEIGGIMTYSTCSFHPIENEAVVASLLRTGCVELLSHEEIAIRMKGIVYQPGLTHWKVLNDECEEVTMKHRPQGWPVSLWPQDDRSIQDSLTRCVRMVPQDNDTGGFFIACLRKVKEYPEDDNEKIKRQRRKKSPLVTTKADHHRLYEVKQKRSKTYKKGNDLREFTRSLSSSPSRTFNVTKSLATYLLDCPGSQKLNLVYAGYDEK